MSIFQNAPPTAFGAGKPLDSDARARAPIFGAGIPAAGCPAKQNGRRLRNGRQRPLVCIWVLGEGRRFRIPDPRRGAAGQQTGSSPAIATSRISGPAGRSSQRRKASLSRLRSRKANAAIISRLYNSTP